MNRPPLLAKPLLALLYCTAGLSLAVLLRPDSLNEANNSSNDLLASPSPRTSILTTSTQPVAVAWERPLRPLLSEQNNSTTTPRQAAVNPIGAITANSLPITAPSLPRTPALPFVYLGQLQGSGPTRVFISQGELNLAVSEGSLIDNVWQVERITTRQMSLRYLPTHETRQLMLGD